MTTPEVVEIVRTEFTAVPPDLTAEIAPVAIPEGLTWGEAAVLWAKDRATIEAHNGDKRAIRSLDETD